MQFWSGASRILQSLSSSSFRLPRYKKAAKSCSFKEFTRSVHSVKGIEQEENGADTDHCAQDERVPPLPQVDSLDEIIDGWETVLESQRLRKIC